jgi:hypothetical protein
MTGIQMHLSDVIGRCVVEGDLIVYRGIIVDHTLKNNRIFMFIDELPRAVRRALFSVHYAGGGRVELMWRLNPPASASAGYAEGQAVSVDTEQWRISRSRLVPK